MPTPVLAPPSSRRARRIATLAVLAALAALAAPGCALEADDAIVPPARPATARQKLEASTAIAQLRPDARLALTARVGVDAAPSSVDVSIAEGYVVVAAERDGSLVLTALDITLDDVVLGEAGGPIEGLRLTDLRGRLARPVTLDTTWLDGDQEAFGAGSIDLLLDWAILTDGGATSPLSTQRIDDIAVQLRVAGDADANLEIDTLAARAGVFWRWSQQIELSDLSLDADAVEL